MSKQHEQEIAQYEGELIYHSDLYFNARTNIERSVENERLFNAGFRLAYNSKRTYNETDKEA